MKSVSLEEVSLASRAPVALVEWSRRRRPRCRRRPGPGVFRAVPHRPRACGGGRGFVGTAGGRSSREPSRPVWAALMIYCGATGRTSRRRRRFFGLHWAPTVDRTRHANADAPRTSSNRRLDGLLREESARRSKLSLSVRKGNPGSGAPSPDRVALGTKAMSENKRSGGCTSMGARPGPGEPRQVTELLNTTII